VKKSNSSQKQTPNKLSKAKLLWITDPWSTLDHSKDTTLRLAQEADLLRVPQSWCDVKSIRLERNEVYLETKPILSVGAGRNPNSFEFGKPETSTLADFTQLHYRPDPPVDQAYQHPLQLLAIASRGYKNCEIVNPPEGLIVQNEKFEAAALGVLMPPSLVSSQWDHLLAFGRAHGRTVLKPLHEAQSHGIELLDWRNKDTIENSREILELATRHFGTPIILQHYLEGINDGETRLWYLDGKLLACVKKHPVTGDFRINMDRGSRLSSTQLSKNEKATALKIGKHLKTRKIRLAAIDLIEGYITDFNFTSPGLISQMEAVLSTNLALPIIKQLIGLATD
jgi:glutathione synthase